MLSKLKQLTRQYSNTDTGKWLKDIDWEKVPVKFKSSLPGDIGGYYSFGKIVVLDTDLYIAFTIYIHQLKHRWQWKTNPIKYIIGKLYRPLIENEAYKQQQYAQNWFLNRD